jgi:NAD(P)-dependent dehydrogenase (short-subunit alcohol dehydrogenase family)
MAGRLEGKIAIVTGGTRGIGLAIASAFVREGARVVVASRKQQSVDAAVGALAALRPDPGRAFGRACHVGKRDDCATLVAYVEAEVGSPDILVNNAATNPYFGPLLGASEAVWDKTFEVNLKGYFEPSRLVAQHLLKAQKPGSIVNVASVVGQRAAPLQGLYGMTKAAVISMTRTLALELGAAGIRVNAIAPGLIETGMTRKRIAESEWFRGQMTDMTPLGRNGQPEDIASAAAFLLSDDAAFISGQVLVVDGGWIATRYRAQPEG